ATGQSSGLTASATFLVRTDWTKFLNTAARIASVAPELGVAVGLATYEATSAVAVHPTLVLVPVHRKVRRGGYAKPPTCHGRPQRAVSARHPARPGTGETVYGCQAGL